MKKRIGYITHVVGFLLLIEGFFMGITCLVSLFYDEFSVSKHIGFSTMTTLLVGAVMLLFCRKFSSSSLGKREGFAIVTLSWIFFSFFGALPFWISGAIPSYTDAFFETISGFTTTGSTILVDIEALPKGLLFWRSIIQWLGGMGIIVFSLALLHIQGDGGNQLFSAEVPGPTQEKIHPKISATAKRLWLIYVFFTALETLLLHLGGMEWFDAVCHSFTTMATGGYSTKQMSIAHWDSAYIEYVITFFMFLAGMNFTLIYFGFKGRFRKIWSNEEFRFYGGFIFLFTLISSLVLMGTHTTDLEGGFRQSLFQVVSIITTTGYGTVDYLLWPPVLIMLMFLLMFVGGSAGSTGGGIKIVRIVLLLKNSLLEFKRLIHPRAVIPVRFNNKSVPQAIVTNVLAFVSIYVILFLISLLVMAAMGLDFETSLGSVATSFGNIGPGLGEVGPAGNFAAIPTGGKWYLSFLMLLGRLELFTVLIIFSPAFWKK